VLLCDAKRHRLYVAAAAEALNGLTAAAPRLHRATKHRPAMAALLSPAEFVHELVDSPALAAEAKLPTMKCRRGQAESNLNILRSR